MTQHFLKATPDTVHWGYWDGSLAPVTKIVSGDRVTIETVSGDVPHLPKPQSGFDILPDHRAVLDAGRRGPGPHHLTGPIEIEGAEPGHVLEVRILDIRLRQNWGWNVQLPCMGTLPEDFHEARLFHIGLDAAANTAKLPWGQTIPLDPFFGAFGVAPPAKWGRLSSKEPRAFGGNMDNKEPGAGANVYFQIFHKGA